MVLVGLRSSHSAVVASPSLCRFAPDVRLACSEFREFQVKEAVEVRVDSSENAQGLALGLEKVPPLCKGSVQVIPNFADPSPPRSENGSGAVQRAYSPIVN